MERKVQDVIRMAFSGMTVISVTSSATSAKGYDAVLVLAKGEVASFGPPAQVVESCEYFKS
jgi:ABC-type multidrug transport system fused ATPase/permease subunit